MEQSPYVLADMTSPETAEALNTALVAIIPTGSHEQHGSHMALKTDIANAEGMALGIAQRLGPKAVLTPPLPFGISPHHMAFPGTITVRPETFLAVLEDVITSLKSHGMKKLFILNGHGGNIPSLEQLMLTIKRDLGVDVDVIDSHAGPQNDAAVLQGRQYRAGDWGAHYDEAIGTSGALDKLILRGQQGQQLHSGVDGGELVAGIFRVFDGVGTDEIHGVAMVRHMPSIREFALGNIAPGYQRFNGMF